jgi:hypothetical protein
MRRGVLHYLRSAALVLLPALAALLLCRPAAAQLLVTSADGNMTYHLGILAQVQGQIEENAKPDSGNADQIGYFRRLRLQGEFTFYKNLIVFFETDNPNYGKDTNSSGTKNEPSIFFQTVYVTYQFAPEFSLEGGEMLTPNSYNHGQSAASIMPIDLGAFTNTESTPISSNNGRDFGVEARGYVADHLEYRGGIFQGLRGTDDINSFRYAGRLSYYFVGIETSRFYRGTSLGKYQTLEVGGSYDAQKTYKNYDIDAFYDQPTGGGNGFTAQFDYNWIDGGKFITALPKQNVLLAELGYYVDSIKTQPFAQYTTEKYASGVALPDQKQWQVGLGWYFHGYQSNFKIGYGMVDELGFRNRSNIVAQYQFSGF